MIIGICGILNAAYSQASVGIGTASPNSKAILELSSTTQVFLPPRMDTGQMNNIVSPPYGSFIYNTTLHTPMAYARMGYKPTIIPKIFASNDMWVPVSVGPKVLAWGVVDTLDASGSAGNENTGASYTCRIAKGSGNFSVRWRSKADNNSKWYELSLNNDNYDKKEMLLVITAVGNGSWDVTPAIGVVINGSDANATIKFTDISRSVAGWNETDRRRRSEFYFVLYDLRGY